MPVTSDSRGHRVLPHTADMMFEAWAPSRDGCIAEAVAAMVECFVDTSTATPVRTLPFDLPPDSDDGLLVAVLEEALYVLEIFGLVPVATRVEGREDGGLTGWFDAARVKETQLVGSVPKGVTLHELQFGRHDGRWECLVTVDV